MRDLFNNINLKPGMNPVAATTDNTAYVSSIVDLANTEGAVFAILTGSLADADATFAVTVSVGNDSGLSDGAAAPASALLGTLALAGFTFAADNSVFKIGVQAGYKRYAQVTVTPSGNTGNVFMSGVWITQPVLKPTANPPA